MAPTQDVVGFAPLIPTSPQQVVWIEQGDVLHHCSYRRVNGWLPLLTNNPLSWHDASRLDRIALPVGSTTHRFRVRITPHGRSPARPNAAATRFATCSSVCRAASGTNPHTTDDRLWNGRGQPDQFWEFPVWTAVDNTGLPTTAPAGGKIEAP